MPEMPIKTKSQRENARYEQRVGKAIKDWVTNIMKTTGMTRVKARELVIQEIEMNAIARIVPNEGILYDAYKQE